MSNRTLNKVLALDHQRVELVGSFSTNGTSAPTGLKGQGVTVARTGTGKFTVTLADPYVDIIAADASLSLGTPAALQAQVSGWTAPGGPGSRGVLTITVIDGSATATDVAAATGNSISFRIVALQSGAKPT